MAGICSVVGKFRTEMNANVGWTVLSYVSGCQVNMAEFLCRHDILAGLDEIATNQSLRGWGAGPEHAIQ